MQFSMIIATISALAGSALSAPATTRGANPLLFGIQLSNDISGQPSNANIIVNNPSVTLGELFGSDFGTQVLATSLQAVSPGAGGNNVQCVIKNPDVPGQAFYLSAWNTFIDLDGNVDEAIPTDVTAFTIECQL
jgi:hypothetical protein